MVKCHGTMKRVEHESVAMPDPDFVTITSSRRYGKEIIDFVSELIINQRFWWTRSFDPILLIFMVIWQNCRRKSPP